MNRNKPHPHHQRRWKGPNEINMPLSDMRGIYVITLKAGGVLIDSKKIIK